ncbi:MAG: 4Fe-4S binding protein [Deltaproteobacteria bacterium]|jgi:dissimilatory sulfite reductase (desulfoviridin) alpha/beta subunit|nr:4Fe-4S binding protein [Deltaproteobacteria bacterium]
MASQGGKYQNMVTDYKALKNGGFMRQVQKDLFSLRLKVVGGNLTTDQVRVIAQVADRYGSGHVHLTSRQGLEIPFIALKDVETVKGELAAGGVDAGVCGPRVRTVTACQGSGVCPSGCVDTLALAQGISDRYFGRVLPHKFKFGVTGCQNNCLKAEENDMGIKGGYLIEWLSEPCLFCGICAKACREGAIRVGEDDLALDRSKCNHCGRCVKSCPADAWKAQSGYLLSFGGTFGNRIAKGEEIFGIVTDLETIYRASDAALDFFERHGQPGERFRATIERAGWDGLKKALIDRGLGDQAPNGQATGAQALGE